MTKLNIAFMLLACFFLGCNAEKDVEQLASANPSTAASDSEVPESTSLSDRDEELIRYLLNDSDDHPADRIYFLTTTPMDK